MTDIKKPRKPRRRKQLATDAEMNALKQQYQFAVKNCGHEVTAKTVAGKLGLNKSSVYRAVFFGAPSERVISITNEYKSQIQEFAKTKALFFAELAAHS